MKTICKKHRSFAFAISPAWILAALLCILPRLTAGPPSQQQPSAVEKTAAQYYRNVQVLKDIPASQLFPTMRYITVALGVRCEYCHDMEHFDSDDKPEKQRARNMMKMLFTIDSENFNGRREVTCFTCHRGAPKPVPAPVLPDVIANAAAAAPVTAPSAKTATEPANAPAVSAASLPTVDQILDRYVEALGGSAAIQKISTLVERGTFEVPARGFHAAIELDRKTPDKVLTTLQTPIGASLQGYDGTIAWERAPNGEVGEQTGDKLAQAKQWASLYPGQHFKQEYSRLQVNGIEKIAGRDAYRVLGWRPGGGADRLYFDAQSGLLLRVSGRIETALGSLPEETNYQDYREVNGLQVPFTIQIHHFDASNYTWEKIEANVPLDDSRFEKPAEKPTDKPADKSSNP